MVIDVGCSFHLLHVHRCHWLNPHGLPYAGNRCVPYSAGVAHLLAAGLISVVGTIIHAHIYRVLSAHIERSRNVETKCSVAACMTAHLNAVYPHIGTPIHSTEVEHHIAALPCLRHSEAAIIP